MAIEAELHDGTILEFPDGTAPDVVDRAVKSQIKAAGVPQPLASDTGYRSASASSSSSVPALDSNEPIDTSAYDVANFRRGVQSAPMRTPRLPNAQAPQDTLPQRVINPPSMMEQDYFDKAHQQYLSATPMQRNQLAKRDDQIGRAARYLQEQYAQGDRPVMAPEVAAGNRARMQRDEEYRAKGEEAIRNRSYLDAAILDPTKQLAAGVNTLGRAATGLLAPGSAADNVFKENVESWNSSQSEGMQKKVEFATERIKAAAEAGTWEEVKTALGEYATDPALFAKLTLETLPSMLPALGAIKAARLATLARGASETAAISAGLLAGRSVNAGMNAGGARSQAYDEAITLLKAKGITGEEADSLASKYSLAPALVGGFAGWISGGSGLESVLAGGAKKGVRSQLINALKEIAGEQFEEVPAQITQNAVLRQPLMKDVGQTIAQTLIASAPGATIAGMSGSGPQQEASPAAQMRADLERTLSGQGPVTAPQSPQAQQELPAAKSRTTVTLPDGQSVTGTVIAVEPDQEAGGWTMRIRDDSGETHMVYADDGATFGEPAVALAGPQEIALTEPLDQPTEPATPTQKPNTVVTPTAQPAMDVAAPALPAIEQAQPAAMPAPSEEIANVSTPDQLQPEATNDAVREGGGERAQSNPAAPVSAKTFKTAKGSTYQVYEDGTTTRDKAYRPEHGQSEQGPQPRSQQTFYVTPDDANKLGEIQAQGTARRTIQTDGKQAGIRYEEGPSAGKLERRTVVPVQSSPAVGLTPVEVWADGSTHFGNPIIEVSNEPSPLDAESNQPRGDNAGGSVGIAPDQPIKQRRAGRAARASAPRSGENQPVADVAGAAAATGAAPELNFDFDAAAKSLADTFFREGRQATQQQFTKIVKDAQLTEPEWKDLRMRSRALMNAPKAKPIPDSVFKRVDAQIARQTPGYEPADVSNNQEKVSTSAKPVQKTAKSTRVARAESKPNQEAKPLQDVAASEVAAESKPADQEDQASANKAPKTEGESKFQSVQKAPSWYRSALADAVTTLTKQADKDGKIPAAQAKARLLSLQKDGKFKQDELQWSGVLEWLDMQPSGKVSVSDIESFVRDNGVRVQEVRKGGESRRDLKAVRDSDGSWSVISNDAEVIASGLSRSRADDLIDGYHGGEGATKYSDYQLPGGNNYRELLLTLPTHEGLPKGWVSRNDSSGWSVRDDNGRTISQWQKTEGEAIRLALNHAKATLAKGEYHSSHWDEPNILAHIRFNERTDADGSRVLFIEEIQSDYGQDAKKKGIGDTQPAMDIAALKAQGWEIERSSIDPAKPSADPDNQGFIAHRNRATFGRRVKTEAEAWKTAHDIQNPVQRGVPSAPFIGKTESWVSLALKRVIAYAVENGFDRVAFINGEQSADRYDLSKQIKQIKYAKMLDGDGYYIQADDMRGVTVVDEADVSAHRLEELVGKEIGQRIVDTATGDEQYLRGLDLKVGGEGMKAFYDKIIPNVAKDVLKKIGGGQMQPIRILIAGDKVEAGGMRTGAKRVDQPGFDITPKMREAVSQGLPLFQSSAKFTDKFQSKRDEVAKAVADIAKKMVPQTNVEVVDSIFAPDGSEQAGASTAASNLIRVSIRSPNPVDTMRHEAVHALKAMGLFTAPEWRALQDKARSTWRAKYNIDARYKGQNLSDADLLEEAIAEGFAKWQKGEPAGGFIGRAFNKMAEFFKRVGNMLRGMGFNTVEDIFGKVESGDVGGRQGRAASGKADQSQAPSAKSANLPEETRTQAVQRRMQDQMNRFRVLRDTLKKAGIELPDSSDVYNAEIVMHGKIAAQVEDFRNKVLDPLIEAVQAKNFTMDQVAEYLQAQHAPEANARMRKLYDDENATAAGMTDEQAEEILSTAPEGLKEVANDIRKITDKTRNMLLKAGIISKDMAKAWQAAYQYYVPLRGDGEPSTGTGKGLSVNGKQQRRLGHGERDEKIIENIIMAHERAIHLVEKNEVGKTLLNLVAELQDPDIATVGQPEKRKVFKEGAKTYVVTMGSSELQSFDNMNDARKFIEYLGRSENIKIETKRSDPSAQYMAKPQLADNEVAVYMNGESIRVQLNDELLARAYTRLGQESVTGILQYGRTLNSWLSKAYTAYNPEFPLVNLTRDFTSGLFNLTAEYGAGMAAKAVLNYPKAIADAVRYSYTGKESAVMAEYRREGGSTGAGWMGDIERIGKDVQNTYDEYVGAVETARAGRKAAAVRVAATKLVGSIFRVFEHVNAATENGMRLATYKTLKDAGATPRKAAVMSKNVSLNFNRKGEAGPQLSALYLFYNPAVQGTERLLYALMQSPKKYQARAIISAIPILAYTLAAGQWEDDYDTFEKISAYDKAHNLIIRTGKDSYIKIPLPYELAAFFNIGNVMYQLEHQAKGEGKNSAIKKASTHLASGFFESYMPFGNPFEGGAVEMLPTVPKMVVQASENRARNRDIAPESSFDENKPDFLKMNRTTKGTNYAKLSEMMNMASGGTETQKGNVDVSPEMLRFWVRNFTGGAGTSAVDFVDLGKLGVEWAKASGAEKEALEPEIKEMPIVRRFAGESRIQGARAVFWEKAKEAESALDDFKRAKKAKEPIDKTELAKLGGAVDNYRKAVKAKRDAVDKVLANDSLTLGQKRIQTKQLEAEEEVIYQKFLDAFAIRVEGREKK